MPSTAKLRSTLLTKLKELFQLDQPDLDFGFYRIMHAKAQQVTEFLEKDLLQVIADTFGTIDESRRAELQAAYDLALKTARDFGAPDPEATEPVRKARAALGELQDSATQEGEIYDHLHRFFERYYEDGDFISRRYFSRETAGRAAPFAIPYNGEEVKLHWANADQYYIKTGEYFSNFSVDLAKAPEAPEEMKLESADSLPVHFRVVDAAEGEHGNVKASDTTKRFFILHAEDPFGFDEKGGLELRFEYRPDPDKPEKSQDGKWQEELRARAVGELLEKLAAVPEAAAWHRLLAAKAPTEAHKERTLLAKYLHQYTARNTADYFIHKDLGSFLRRELDFYIKNEVMRLDDIENEDAPRVESYLAKLKVLRAIARQLIAFLAQLEDFQKKLWLKKKFVTETNYGITLDRVPEELYPEIAGNDAQWDEWEKLYAISAVFSSVQSERTTITQNRSSKLSRSLSSAPTGRTMAAQGNALGELGEMAAALKGRSNDGDASDAPSGLEETGGGTVPGRCPGLSSDAALRLRVLQAQPHLVLDTRHFPEEFKARLVESIENFDEQCDGLLVHSENFSGMEVIASTFKNRINYTFIDPPYNTGSGDFCYKDSYQHSSWLAMMSGRLNALRNLIAEDWLLLASISDIEAPNLRYLYDAIFGDDFLATLAWQKTYSPRMDALTFSFDFDSVLAAGTYVGRLAFQQDKKQFSKKQEGLSYRRRTWRKEGSSSRREDRPNLFYPITTPDGTTVFPIRPDGTDGRWRGGMERFNTLDGKGLIEWQKRPDGWQVFVRQMFDDSATRPPSTFLTHDVAGHNHEGVEVLKMLMGGLAFDNPKPPRLVEFGGRIASDDPSFLTLDFFAGSGTTGHAVINLNREDNGRRKYILIEMGDHFDTVLKPRIAKVVYSPDWKDGKPVTRDKGISHCFKYLRLESYEDTLNNLDFVENKTRDEALKQNEPLRRDYTLNYLLDVETRGSQSLLNLDAFTDPTAYTLKVKKPGASGSIVQAVDLIETFNFLIGLRLVHLAAPQRFSATFHRVPDPDLPEGTDTRLQLTDKMRQSADGAWWFRKVEGWVPKDRENPNNGQKEKVLIVWRTLTGNLEEDNLMLDEWFQKNRLSTRDFEFDTIYVNGSNNLPNLKLDTDTWKVRLLEEEFHKAMWDMQEG